MAQEAAVFIAVSALHITVLHITVLRNNLMSLPLLPKFKIAYNQREGNSAQKD